jgi:hypothetical protein
MFSGGRVRVHGCSPGCLLLSLAVSLLLMVVLNLLIRLFSASAYPPGSWLLRLSDPMLTRPAVLPSPGILGQLLSPQLVGDAHASHWERCIWMLRRAARRSR